MVMQGGLNRVQLVVMVVDTLLEIIDTSWFISVPGCYNDTY